MSVLGDAQEIIKAAIRQVLPGESVKRELQGYKPPAGRLYVVSVGKAAYTMAAAAKEVLGDQIHSGIVITKYGHIKGELEGFSCFEGGHPTPDENSFLAAEKALELTKNLTREDEVLFLLSGGASALFEKPMIPGEELLDITKQLLACGADITEINIVRKHLSCVKGGRFARWCMPAHVHSVILSDVVGGRLDSIGSGPACVDLSTSGQAMEIVKKYGIRLSAEAENALRQETPKRLENTSYCMIGDVKLLCEAAAGKCRELGYETQILTDSLSCEAKEAGSFLSAIARTHDKTEKSLAFIAGGETVVHLSGTGKGGRNQELALSAAEGLMGLHEVCIFSVGSDGTDGPTDAAGGIVDAHTACRLKAAGIDIYQTLRDNNAYYALQAADGLVFTGPTGTNVNDVAVLLIKRQERA